MALRHFKDSGGHEWRVWDVVPYAGQPAERRGGDRRVAASGAYTGPERRTRDRRVRTPALMTPGLESGWLCFETDVDKRRLTPIPAGWDRTPQEELEALLARANSVNRRRD
ncbi:MAG TPA: hypothetical protein VEX86_01310 [Longimicrobium sp.]|nr:hypothetical protein [Longimicrobium sp.]